MSQAVLPYTHAEAPPSSEGRAAASELPLLAAPQRKHRSRTLRSMLGGVWDRAAYAANLSAYWALNRIPSRPRVLQIELTNHCNLNCTVCDRIAVTREKRLIDWSLFERLCLDGITFGIPQIGLGLFGEPTLHPQLPEMIAFAKQNGAKRVAFTTNGTLLKEDTIRRILEAGVDRIEVSIDGFKRSTVENIRVGASYDALVANVHTLLKIRDELKAHTAVQLNYVCTRETISEVRDFYRYWRRGVDDFYFIPFMGYADVQGMSSMAAPRRRTKCYMLWYVIVSSVDGRAGVCCHGDPNMDVDVGDLNTHTLKEVWNGSAIKTIRAIHRKREWSALPVCANCDMTSPYTRWVKHFATIYRRVHLGS